MKKWEYLSTFSQVHCALHDRQELGTSLCQPKFTQIVSLKFMKKPKGALIYFIVFIYLVSITLLTNSVAKAQTNNFQQSKQCSSKQTRIFGVTTEIAEVKTQEDVQNLDRLIFSLNKIREHRIPTVRIVFQTENQAADYLTAVKRLHGVKADGSDRIAYVMGLIVDSQFMYEFNDIDRHPGRDILRRTENFAEVLGDFVDIWEVGNEVNGEWVGWKGEEQNNGVEEHEQQTDPDKLTRMRILIGTQVHQVYRTLKAHQKVINNCAEIALNLYLKDNHSQGDELRECYWEKCPGGCGRRYGMFEWIAENLKPKQNDLKFDFVFFSYYDEDCKDLEMNGRKLAKIFDDLIGEFTFDDGFKPKVGFGEVGPQCNCRKGDKACEGLNSDVRRAQSGCRRRQPDYVGKYYKDIHKSVKNNLTANKNLYVGGFFYWYFYQDAVTENGRVKDVLEKFIEAAKKRDW
jgi:hypothetical protein